MKIIKEGKLPEAVPDFWWHGLRTLCSYCKTEFKLEPGDLPDSEGGERHPGGTRHVEFPCPFCAKMNRIDSSWGKSHDFTLRAQEAMSRPFTAFRKQ